MGLLRKLLGAADKIADAESDLEHAVFRDRRYQRAEELAATGDPGVGLVAGIQRRSNDGTTTTRLRIEWYGPDLRSGGILFGESLHPALRLGSTVRIRADGGSVVLDPHAMAGKWPDDPGRSVRKAPDPGVSDTSLDARVLSRLRKWPAETAVVVSFDRVRALGMLTQNWDVVVRRPDGSHATIRRDHVPPYVSWYVHPGAEIPVVVDPKDPGRAQGDWPLLAETRAVAGGTWQDLPPPGSIAESLLWSGDDPVPTAGAGTVTDLPPTPSAPPAAEAIEGVTVEQCARIDAALSRIAPADKDAVACEQHGVPAGRWSAIHGAWQARIRADWQLGVAYGQAYEDASKRR